MKKPKSTGQKKLLGKGDPKPFALKNPKGKAPCVIICDHAGLRIPKALGTLGVSAADRKKHIAWDPGTLEIGLFLSDAIDAPAVLSTYSRLVVDLNRGATSAECMREIYDHIDIPGNKALSKAHKRQRIAEIFTPYHANVAKTLKAKMAGAKLPLVISLHSFTPKMDGFKRPWHIGVLWNKEEGLAQRLVDQLRFDNPKLVIGENEPYSLKSANLAKNTISTHAESRGLPYIIVEFRQDLVATKAGAEKWAKLFLKSLKPILADPDVYRPRRLRIAKKR